jgi:nitroreductase
VTGEGDFFTVARSQRAHRSFTDDPVPDHDLVRILEAATWAPSAENTQPWVFVVVRDPGRRAALDALARRLWAAGAKEATAQRSPAALVEDVDQATAAGFGGAPVIVVVAGDSARCHRTSLAASVFPAVQNLLLAAGALGYGTALTTLTTFATAEVRELLDLPEAVEPLAVVPVGRPARRLGPSRREPFAERTHLDGYGRRFPAPDAGR